jgi:uncharacterized membrane protein
MQVCSCSTLFDSISVTNTGSFVGSYTISIEGVGAEYSTLSDSILILEPGHTGSVENIINLPCDKFGNLGLKVKVVSNTGVEEIIPIFLEVNKCSNNKFEFINGNSFTNIPCSTTRYDTMLSNIGPREEIYDLSVEGIPREYVTFTENPIILSSGENKHIIALINMPCEEYGSFEGSIVSTARSSDIRVELPFYLGIKREYNYSVSFGEYVPDEVDGETVYSPVFPNEVPEYALCEGVTSGIPVKVSNDVFVSNTFLLEENSNEDWVGLDKDKLNIHGFEKGYFNIVLDPADGDEGSYEVPIHIDSVRGDLSFDYNLPYTVEDCTSFSLEMKSYDETCCGISSYTLTVRNTGSRDNIIELETPNNQSWLSQYAVAVKAGEEHDITFNVYKPCDEELDSDVMKVNAKVKGDISEEREAAIKLDYVSSKECHALSFSKGYQKVFYEYREKPLKIKNVGIKASDYKIYTEAPDWVTLSDYNFSLEPGETKVITINYNPTNTTEATTYYVTLNLMSDNDYTHVHTVYSELKVKTGQEEFMQFLEENKVLSLFMILILIALIILVIFLITLISKKEKKRVPKAPKPVKEKKAKTVNKAEKKVVIKEKKESNKADFWKWAFFILLAVIILLIILSFTANTSGTEDSEDKEPTFIEKASDYIKGLFERPTTVEENNITDNDTEKNEVTTDNVTTDNVTVDVPDVSDNVTSNFTEDVETEDEESEEANETAVPEKPYEERLYDYLVENNLTDSFQYQVWSMDNDYELNLSPYFVDPDSDDELIFTSTTPRFVNVRINGSMVYFTPDEGWKGVDYVTFKATDKTGAYVITPEVALVVREKHVVDRPLAIKITEFLNQNLMYIVFGVIILIILIMILTAGNGTEKK